jgi:RNA polymerase sigma factor (sigma-70 family)
LDEIAKLIEPQIPALRRYAYALVRDHDAADDLVQDCLERAVSRWYLRRDDGHLRAWLFTMLRNLYINSYHRQKRRGTRVRLDESIMPSVAPNQTDQLEMNDVLSALERLPEDHKSILLLIGVEDLSYEETARVLSVPVGTVMSRLSRARQGLRALLSGSRVTPLRRVK